MASVAALLARAVWPALGLAASLLAVTPDADLRGRQAARSIPGFASGGLVGARLVRALASAERLIHDSRWVVCLAAIVIAPFAAFRLVRCRLWRLRLRAARSTARHHSSQDEHPAPEHQT